MQIRHEKATVPRTFVVSAARRRSHSACFLAWAITIVLTGSCVFSASQEDAIPGGISGTGPLAALIKPYLDRHELAGAVILVANQERVVDREAIGFADIAEGRLMEADSLFWIASMGKAMTASTVMMLVDEGRLKLDDPVEKYLPEFKGQKVAVSLASAIAAGPSDVVEPAARLEAAKHPITIREILSHTSGLPFSSKREPGALDLQPLSTAVENYAAEPLAFQPGQKYSYSNEGINTAGRIVEVVSGMPFELFLQERLFDPLDMNDTTFWPSGPQLGRLAKSYRRASAAGDLLEIPITQLTYPLDDRSHRFPFPAGGLFSTGDDVARFCQLMLGDGVFRGRRYLSKESVRLMTSKETGDAVSTPYGLGWNIGEGYFEHAGAYKTDMEVDTKNGLILVLLVQRADDWPEENRRKLRIALEEAAIAHFRSDFPVSSAIGH
jgi:CubicO group peptidase (beta-lactamase class C family)